MALPDDYASVALAFARALAARDYATAHAMGSSDYQRRLTPEQMRASFEAIVPPDWGAIGSVDVGHTMEDWPGKQASDVGWAYLSIGGDVYSEAITVIVTAENGSPKVRDVEFGRP